MGEDTTGCTGVSIGGDLHLLIETVGCLRAAPFCKVKSEILLNAVQVRSRGDSSFLHGWEAVQWPKLQRGRAPRTILKLPDLEQSKTAVLNSLGSPSSRRSYDHAIRDFIDWYCSEPRLAFNRTVVTRYRISLEQRRYAPATINLRLAAVRRLAYEASDCGLLSPDLAAGIRRVKGAKRLGVRIGNWLSAEQGKTLISAPAGLELRNVRDRAVLAMLIGCGLRRAEIVTVRIEDLQLREDHWILADLVGKGGHVRTVPVPAWVKATVDAWLKSAGLASGTLFRSVAKSGKVWGSGFTAKVIYSIVRKAALDCGFGPVAPHDLRSPLSSSWRGARTDTVPARARVRPDD
jgi:integrase